MKKSITQFQYHRLLTLYHKLNARLNRHFSLGRFHQFSKQQQYRLLQRIERIKAQLVKLESCLKLAGTCLVVGATFLASDAEAQFGPIGSEFLVNSFTTSHQRYPSTAMDSDGDFVVVWSSYNQALGEDIYAQRYNSSGSPIGLEFRVNTYTTSDQSLPKVAMDSDGDFVVVWESKDQDTDAFGVYGQRYNSLGNPEGSEFRVNTYTTSDQRHPAVAMDSDGAFVVVWDSNLQDGAYQGLYGQRYDSEGLPQGIEFQVNTYTSGSQTSPSITMNNDGAFVVAWNSYGQDGFSGGVFAQRYDFIPLSPDTEFQVNTYTSQYQGFSSIAMDSDGGFVVVWKSSGQDGSLSSIYGQRYDASGAEQGSEFQVNTYTTKTQEMATVAMDSDGDFVVVWSSQDQDGSGFGIYGQRYNASGVALESEFLINTSTGRDQRMTGIAMDSDGDFVVVWASDRQDGSDYGVYAQRYNGGFATPTAIQNSQETLNVNLYPNPAKDEVHLEIQGEVSIKVFNLSGQVLREEVLENQTFHVAGLQSGIYLVEIEKEGIKKMKKLVVE